MEGEEWVQTKELSEVSSTEPENEPDSAVMYQVVEDMPVELAYSKGLLKSATDALDSSTVHVPYASFSLA